MTDNKKTTCPNCKQKFDKSFNYCPYCGQKNSDVNIKLRHFLSEFFSANFNFDSKIFKTLKLLILRPGELSTAFLHGKRVSYITPVRLYLFVSFIYFFIISILPQENIITVDNPGSTVIGVKIDTPNDTLKLAPAEKKFLYNIEMLKTQEGTSEFWQIFRKNLSLGMFFFIPLTAWFLYILFRKKHPHYIPHLIFTIHFQTLVFLIFAVTAILRLFINSNWLIFAEASALTVLLFYWLKAFYKEKTWKILWKMSVFLTAWSGILIFFVIIIVFISIFLYN